MQLTYNTVKKYDINIKPSCKDKIITISKFISLYENRAKSSAGPRVLSNISTGVLSTVKHLRCSVSLKAVNGWKPVAVFGKCSILEIS